MEWEGWNCRSGSTYG